MHNSMMPLALPGLALNCLIFALSLAMHDSMMPLALPGLALNCLICYLCSESGDGAFLCINSVKNCKVQYRNRMVLFVRVLIFREGEILYVSFFRKHIFVVRYGDSVSSYMYFFR